MRVLQVHNDYMQVGGERHTVQEINRALNGITRVSANLHLTDNDRVASSGFLRQTRDVLWNLDAARGLKAALQEHQPDVVHLHNTFPNLGNAALKTLSDYGVPVVQHLHNYRQTCLAATHFRNGAECHRCTTASTAVAGVRFACYRGSRAQSLGALAHDQVRREVLRRTQLEPTYLAISDFVLAYAKRTAASAVRVYNPVEAEGGPGPGGGGIMVVGRLEAEKGLPQALEVADALHSLIPTTIVGDGSLRASVQSWAAQGQGRTWYRDMPKEQLMSMLGGAELVLVLSKWAEPFGRVAVESMAMGTPCIVSDIGGLPELIKPGSGAVVAVDATSLEVASLAAALLEDTTTAKLDRRKLCTAHYQATFAPPVIARELLHLYDSLQS